MRNIAKNVLLTLGLGALVIAAAKPADAGVKVSFW